MERLGCLMGAAGFVDFAVDFDFAVDSDSKLNPRQAHLTRPHLSTPVDRSDSHYSFDYYSRSTA